MPIACSARRLPILRSRFRRCRRTNAVSRRELRARLEQHREKPTCFACHGVMDPLGFALENFNAVGQFRANDPDTLTPIDTAGQLPDGTTIKGGRSAPRAGRSARSSVRAGLTENLMTYALGRSLDYRDMPTVRRIVRQAAADAIVSSPSSLAWFQAMRSASA